MATQYFIAIIIYEETDFNGRVKMHARQISFSKYHQLAVKGQWSKDQQSDFRRLATAT